MNTQYCEKEQTVVMALRSGALPHDLLLHVGNCRVCSEVLPVMESLQDQATFAQHEPHLPNPALIWRRAQGLAREKALARATLPIRIVRICANVVAILVMPWLVFALLKLPLGTPDLGLRHLPTINRAWSAALTGTTLLGVTAALICVSLSSWYMLREN